MIRRLTRFGLELVGALLLFLTFPLLAGLILVGLAGIMRPDDYEPQVAGAIYLALVVVAIFGAYFGCKLIMSDVRRRWPRKTP